MGVKSRVVAKNQGAGSSDKRQPQSVCPSVGKHMCGDTLPTLCHLCPELGMQSINQCTVRGKARARPGQRGRKDKSMRKGRGGGLIGRVIRMVRQVDSPPRDDASFLRSHHYRLGLRRAIVQA